MIKASDNYKIFFQCLKVTSSRLEKEAMLKANAEDPVLQKIFYLAHSPFVKFHIKKIPTYSAVGDMPLWGAMKNLNPLRTREVTGHAARDHLQAVLESVSSDDAWVIERIIAKNMDAGVQSTVNKVWPGLIETFDVMKASNMNAKNLESITYPAIAEVKADGVRHNIFVDDLDVLYFSRSGKEYDYLGIPDLAFIELKNSFGEAMVFDGEVVVHGPDNKPLPRKTSNGIISKVLKETAKVSDIENVVFYLWDAIPYKDWLKGKYSERQDHRKQLLVEAAMKLNSKHIKIIEGRTVKSLEDAQEYYQEQILLGREGIILKNAKTEWSLTRSKEHIKFKAENECDLLCTGYKPGTGKYEGLIGSLDLQTSDGKIKVNVGSGLNDADRKKDPSEYIGKVISIVYNEKISSGDSWSLFLPRFIEIRDDKTEADSFEDLS